MNTKSYITRSLYGPQSFWKPLSISFPEIAIFSIFALSVSNVVLVAVIVIVGICLFFCCCCGCVLKPKCQLVLVAYFYFIFIHIHTYICSNNSALFSLGYLLFTSISDHFLFVCIDNNNVPNKQEISLGNIREYRTLRILLICIGIIQKRVNVNIKKL